MIRFARQTFSLALLAATWAGCATVEVNHRTSTGAAGRTDAVLPVSIACPNAIFRLTRFR